MLKKISNFIYKEKGYFVQEIVYHYKAEPSLGYILCFGWKVFGISGYSLTAICCDKKTLDKEVELRRITL
jgi:hypothetical protein